jgi:hypothetical protein
MINQTLKDDNDEYPEKAKREKLEFSMKLSFTKRN